MNGILLAATTKQINPAFIYALLTVIVILAVAIFITDVKVAKKKGLDRRIAKFEKIRFDIFKEDFEKQLAAYFPDITEEKIREIYDSIKLPLRGTAGAAGYDFYSPVNLSLPFGKSVVIPTGIRCRIDEAWVLEIVPRSGNGFKYGIRLANTTGVIDSDYYSSSRDGHIMIKIVNNDPAVNVAQNAFECEEGKGFAQGRFFIYGITEDDEASAARIDGFGSTDKK